MSDPFFILGLPRSRTAWLATWLSYNGRICWHDALGHVTNENDLRALVDAGACGFAETAGSYFPRVLHRAFPKAKFVFVTRLSTDVVDSLNRLGKNGSNVVNVASGALQEAIAYLTPRTDVKFVQFEKLDDFATLANLWRALRSDPFPSRYTTAMLQMRVTKLRPFAGRLPVDMLLKESQLAEQQEEVIA